LRGGKEKQRGGAAVSEVNVTVRFAVGETRNDASDAIDKLRELWAIKFLRERGYDVARANEHWEKTNAFCWRLKIHTETLRRALLKSVRPTVLVRRGEKTGRIMEILSNPAFEAFLTRNKQRRNRLSKIS
jgi:hypothetical protein